MSRREMLLSTCMTSLFGDLAMLQRSTVSVHMTKSSSHQWYEFVFVMRDTQLTCIQCLFEPRVIEFEQKRAGMRFLMRAPDMAEEMVEQSADKFSERYVSPSVADPKRVGVPMLTRCEWFSADPSDDDIHAAPFPCTSSAYRCGTGTTDCYPSGSDTSNQRRAVRHGDPSTGC